jgi:hypothetical protein
MLEEVVIGKKSVNSTDYRVDQAGISDNTFLPIITKERTEGGLNKGAYLLPLYSNHFWFFRIEQSRVLYGDSITPFTISRLSHSFFQQGGLIGFSSFQGRRPLSPDKTRLIPLYTTMIRRYCYIDILAEDRVHSTWYHHTLDIS